MELKWTGTALSDRVPLHEFLAAVNPRAAALVVQSFAAAPHRLVEYPRVGEQLEEFSPREVSRIRRTVRHALRDSGLRHFHSAAMAHA